MFDQFTYHCLELDPETGKWHLVKSTESENLAGNIVLWTENLNNLDETRLVVGPVRHDEFSTQEVYDDGRYRLRPHTASNKGKKKQPWPARVTAEIVAVIEEEYPMLMAAELAALEKRRQQKDWQEADREMIRRDQALMDEEAGEKPTEGAG